MIALSSSEIELDQRIGHRYRVRVGIRPIAVNEVDVRWCKSEVIDTVGTVQYLRTVSQV